MAYGTVNADVIGTSVAGSNLGAGNASIMKNRIINGAMVIDQRNAGASITPSNGQYNLDRWVTYAAQSSKFTVQQNAGSVTPPAGFTKYLGITSSSAYSSISTDYFILMQKIEGYNIADLGWGTANAKTVTLSFQVYSSLTGTFSGALLNSAENRSYPFTYTVSSANTWTTASVTIAGDTTGTWATDNTGGIEVVFNLGSGSTRLGTAGSWSANGYLGATGSVSVVGTNGATFYITGVQLEVGSSATGYEYRNYGTELSNCQRYFQIIGQGNSQPIASGFYVGATSVNAAFHLPTTMRTSPTISVVSGTDYYSIYRQGADDLFNSFTLDISSPTTVAAYNNSEVSGTSGVAGLMVTRNANSFFAAQAEL